MILRQKSCNQFYYWYWNSNMTAVVAPKSWLSPFVMQYLAFPGWMMTLLKRQDGYLNQRVILFRLKYDTHSLQMHPESPCRSVVSPTPKLSEIQYALRLVVVSCWYLPSPLPFFQPISPFLSSHISFVVVPNLLHPRIHPCCPASPPPCYSASVFTDDLVCHPHYHVVMIRPHVGSCSLSTFSQSIAVLTTHLAISVVPYLRCCSPTSPPPPYPSLLYGIPSTVLARCCLHCRPYLPSLPLSLSHYLPSFRVLRRCCFSTFFGCILSLLCIVLYYTACSDMLHTTFLTLCSDLMTIILFSLLERLLSVCVMFLLYSDLPRFSPLVFTPLCSNLIIPLSSICSGLISQYLIWSNVIVTLMLWSACSNLLGSACSDLICL